MSLNMVMPIGVYSPSYTGMVQAQKNFDKVAEAVASGINSQVTPADSYVASGLDSNIRSAKQAMENAQIGYNFTAVADSSLASASENFGRIRELTLQAANGVYSDEQRSSMQEEIDKHAEQIKQSLSNAKFNGKQAINAVTPEKPNAIAVTDFMVGANSTDIVTYDPNMTMDSISFDVSTPEAARASLEKVDTMMSDINEKRADIGATQVRLEGAIELQSNNIISTTGALSSIQDTDYLTAIADLKKSQFSMEAMAKVMKTVMNSERYVLNLLD